MGLSLQSTDKFNCKAIKSISFTQIFYCQNSPKFNPTLNPYSQLELQNPTFNRLRQLGMEQNFNLPFKEEVFNADLNAIFQAVDYETAQIVKNAIKYDPIKEPTKKGFFSRFRKEQYLMRMGIYFHQQRTAYETPRCLHSTSCTSGGKDRN